MKAVPVECSCTEYRLATVLLVQQSDLAIEMQSMIIKGLEAKELRVFD